MRSSAWGRPPKRGNPLVTTSIPDSITSLCAAAVAAALMAASSADAQSRANSDAAKGPILQGPVLQGAGGRQKL